MLPDEQGPPSDAIHGGRLVERPESLPPAISVVIPVYRNADTLDELHRRLTAALEGMRSSFEIVFVDDACPAGSWPVLEALGLRDRRVVGLRMERNVGQHQAVLAGLSYARGERIVILDADLQDPPEAIPALLAKLGEGYAAVFAGRRGLYESLPRLLTSQLFKSTLHVILGLPRDAGLFVVFDRRVADRLLAYRVRHPFIVAMIGGTGLPMISVPVARDTRPQGRTAYTSLRRLQVAVHALAWAVCHRLGLPCAQAASPTERPRFRVFRGGMSDDESEA